MEKSFIIMRMYDNGETSCVSTGYKTKKDAENDMPRIIRFTLGGYYYITEVYERIHK